MNEKVSIAEIVQLAAVDSTFYSHYFFPKTFRQASPEMHKKIWDLLEGKDERVVQHLFKGRYTALKIYRDGAKTTLLRCFTSKRIAYGISHTILFVSAAQDHAIKSIEWIKKAVGFNKLWADTFRLRPGKKWAGDEIEILHGVDEYPIRVIALGITGQTRGINVDDYRPDLIIVDDPCDRENTATLEQRTKISELFFGSLKEGLAPISETPEAKLALLQTPLNSDDLIEKCMKDRQWVTAEYSCFDEAGKSTWEERYPTELLKQEKQASIDRNQLSIWMREKEVTIIASETSTFRGEWLEYWEVLPDKMTTYIAVDPTPPPKENDDTINPKLDDAVILAIGVYRGKVYVLDAYATKSPSPDDLISKIFEFVIRFKPLRVGFESLLFARTTKFYIEKEMKRRSHFFTIFPVEDKRRKQIRIVQAITDRASNRMLVVHRSQVELIQQYMQYPNTNHDDYLDALSIAIDLINPMMLTERDLEGEFERIAEEEKYVPEIEGWRSVI